MEQKRDEKGRFLKTSPNKEDLKKEIAKLTDELDKAISKFNTVNNESLYWKQEHDRLAAINRKLNKEILTQHNRFLWFLHNTGPITRWRYFRALKKDTL